MMSGGRRSAFREGWALALTFRSGSKKAHWFERDEGGLAVSVCGGQVAYAGQLFHIGSWDACKRCVKRVGEPSQEVREHGFVVAQKILDELIAEGTKGAE